VSKKIERIRAETFFVSALLVLAASYALVVAVRLLRSIAVVIGGVVLVALTVSVAVGIVRRRRDDWR
jgi:hypothetical protein